MVDSSVCVVQRLALYGWLSEGGRQARRRHRRDGDVVGLQV
jgi:hypothetical protein